MQDKTLWQRIEKYKFPVGFDLKLKEEFGAKPLQIRKLAKEYLRFVYLAQVSRLEATPSQEVDRVWHLHLSYTRDYWDNFCPNVLQKPFHHEPCDGSASKRKVSIGLMVAGIGFIAGIVTILTVPEKPLLFVLPIGCYALGVTLAV